MLGPGSRYLVSALFLIATVLYGGVFMDPNAGSERWRFIGLLGAVLAMLSLASVPHGEIGSRENPRLRFWRFNARLLARASIVFAYGVVLYGALAGAVAAVSSLFELDTPGHLYGHLGGWVAFAIIPWVIVGGISELVGEPANESGAAPRLVWVLGPYLYAPVLVVYLAILAAYTIKVAVTWELPRNPLSPIVLFAGFFGFVLALFLEPLNRDPTHFGVARLIRVFPAIFLPLLPLALWAVWVRIADYGWTEFRYLRFAVLLALAILAVAGVHRLFARREPVLLLVPVVLGTTLLLTVIGPWSASAVSRRDQTARLTSALREAGLGDRREWGTLVGPGADSVVVDSALYAGIAGNAAYLLDSHGRDALQPVFPTIPDTVRYGWQLRDQLRLAVRCIPAEREYILAETELDQGIPGIRAGTLYRFESSSEPSAGFRDRVDAGIRTELAGERVIVHGNRPEPWVGTADLALLHARVESERSVEYVVRPLCYGPDRAR